MVARMIEHKSPDGTASFGFREVPESERQRLVNEVFSRSAERYDLMNDLMSGGLHRLWKADLIAMLAPPRGERPFHLIDVAGGTGDVALRFAAAGGPHTRATICDISPEMLAVGRRRVSDAGLADRIALVEGNAEALPFADRTFDAYTIAFGIRNVTRIDKALAEAHRVLRIGGRLLVLEFSEVQVPISVCISSMTSVAILASEPVTSARNETASARLSRAIAHPTAIWSRASAASRARRRSQG